MPAGEASDPYSRSGRVVVIAVEPALLAGALARVLSSRGWQVRRAGTEPSRPGPADALVVSSALAGKAWEMDVPLTIVLSDTPGGSGPGASVAQGSGVEIGAFEGLLRALGQG